MVAESSSAAAATKGQGGGVARTLAQHHKAVAGFLFGFFLVLLLYTAASGSAHFGSPGAIVADMQSTPTLHTDQTTGNGSSGTSLPPSMPNNSSQGSSMEQDDRQETDLTKNMGEQRQLDKVHGTEKSNQIDAKSDDVRGKDTEQSSQHVNDVASDKMEEDLIRQEIEQSGKNNETDIKLDAPRKPICDLSDPRYDICEFSGDARAIGSNRTVLYVPPAGELAADVDGQEWSIRDQSRKYLEYISNVTVRSLSSSQAAVAPECTSRHDVPAVVFAMNGLTSNPWHDFSDVLIPLFLTARAYDGEVQFLVSDLQPWFVDKYRLILRNLSRHDIVDFNNDGGVRCYRHITVGLRSHRDLGIDPARAPRNYTMLDFRLYVRAIYSLPPAGVAIPYMAAAGAPKKPRLMLINRGRTRRFVNFPEVAAAAKAAGFEVLPLEPRRDLAVEELSRAVDSCDVLMGAHGAGLASFFFLRTSAVMLQVVPWGHMEHPSMAFYGGPAREMRLRDVEYSIAAEESTLYEKYGKDHPAVRDPESIHRQGWQLGMRYYWIEQDIRLNVTRFAPTLQKVLRMLKE